MLNNESDSARMERLSIDEVAQKVSTVWDNLTEFSFMEQPRRFNHKSHDYVMEFLQTTMGNSTFSFLDCGVLSCVTFRKLQDAHLNVQYTGIDISSNILGNCKERFPTANWHVMDVRKLTFPDASYDVVHIRHVLEHLPNYDDAIRAVKELRRVAKQWVIICYFIPTGDEELLIEKPSSQGGIVYLNTYNKEKFLAVLENLFSAVTEIWIPDEYRNNQIFVCKV